MQTHNPRNVPCPVCGEQRFRSATNAVQHVESGACSGCRGRDNARQRIYEFIGNVQVGNKMFNILTCSLMFIYLQGSQGMLANPPALEYNCGTRTGAVPDIPYKCQACGKKYKQVSSLMQHQVWRKTYEF